MGLRKGAVVQGSPQDQLTIVRHRPGYAFRSSLLRVVAVVVIAASSFGVAWFYNLETVRALKAEREQLATALVASEARAERLSKRVGILEKGDEVDRQAANTVRGSIFSLESQVDGLEEEVAFYKSIMDPAAVEKGLRIHSLDIDALDDGSYQYRLMLTQVGDNGSVVQGYANLMLVGSDSEGEAMIPLTAGVEADSAGQFFRFRYFQELTGNFSLPDGIEPVRVEVVAESSGGKSRRLETMIEWPTEG